MASATGSSAPTAGSSPSVTPRSTGSLPALGVHVNDIVAIVPTATGKGYWLVGSDGGVFAFGDALFHGSLPGLGAHVSNVVGMASSPTGKRLLARRFRRRVFAFGDALFHGSLPGLGAHVKQRRGDLRHTERQGLLARRCRRRGVQLRRWPRSTSLFRDWGVTVKNIIGLAST